MLCRYSSFKVEAAFVEEISLKILTIYLCNGIVMIQVIPTLSEDMLLMFPHLDGYQTYSTLAYLRVPVWMLHSSHVYPHDDIDITAFLPTSKLVIVS